MTLPPPVWLAPGIPAPVHPDPEPYTIPRTASLTFTAACDVCGRDATWTCRRTDFVNVTDCTCPCDATQASEGAA